MKRAGLNSVLAIGGLAVMGLAGPMFAQTKYIPVDLGTLGGSSASVFGINNLGQAVGDSKTAANITRAFRTAPNSPINPATDDLGTLGGPTSAGYAINDSGQVAGVSSTGLPGPFSSVITRAFRADPGLAMVDLLTLAPSGGNNGFNTSIATAINNSGQVVGSATVPVNLCGSSSHAFKTFPNATINPTNPVFEDLGTLVTGNCRSSTGFGVNTFGVAVGNTRVLPLTSSINHAFRTVAGSMIDLGTLPGGTNSDAHAVNDNGEVVGNSEVTAVPFSSPHAFMSIGTLFVTKRDLGTLGGDYSAAFAINYRYPLDSQVVGDASTAGNAALHAFRYTGNVPSGGIMEDLNDLIPASTGWVLQTARGINNSGQIVGGGLLNGVFHSYRLDPFNQAAANLIDALSSPLFALSPGEINALSAKLNAANAAINSGRNNPAGNQLGAFINQVEAMQRSGRMSAANAAYLIAVANAIIAGL